MSDQPVRWTPLGNLDKDSEYKLVGKGNYIDALDIIKQDDAGQVSGTIQPTQRNKHAFSLGSVQAQNKKYRVTVSGDETKSHALKFLSTKRDLRITTGTGSDGSVEFNGTIADLQSQFNLSNLPGAFQVTVSGNTMDFELAPYPYYQWYLESVGEDDVEVVCIQEAIPIDLAGPLKIVRTITDAEAKSKDPMYTHLHKLGSPFRLSDGDGDDQIVYKCSIPSHSDY